MNQYSMKRTSLRLVAVKEKARKISSMYPRYMNLLVLPDHKFGSIKSVKKRDPPLLLAKQEYKFNHKITGNTSWKRYQGI